MAAHGARITFSKQCLLSRYCLVHFQLFITYHVWRRAHLADSGLITKLIHHFNQTISEERKNMVQVEPESLEIHRYRRKRSVLIWFLIFTATCIAGMILMTTLNNRPEVIEISTTTAMSTTTTTLTTTAPIDLAMLFLCTIDPRNWFYSILNMDKRAKKLNLKQHAPTDLQCWWVTDYVWHERSRRVFLLWSVI